MRSYLTAVFITFYCLANAQDTVTFNYAFVENKELKLINRLNEIKMISVNTTDEKAKNRKILVFKDTYFKGEIISRDTIITCSKKTYKVFNGNDTLNYVVDLCDQLRFDSSLMEFNIYFSAKNVHDSIRSIIEYPSVSYEELMAGTAQYDFRLLQTTNSKGTFSIPIGSSIPVIAFTPPYKLSDGAGSYCLINNETPDKFYEKHGIEHYYIYHLKIE